MALSVNAVLVTVVAGRDNTHNKRSCSVSIVLIVCMPKLVILSVSCKAFA